MLARHAGFAALALAVVLIGCSGIAGPSNPTRAELGRQEFEKNCAGCHGIDGKGRGNLTPDLRQVPPDLTLLAQRNHGLLPARRLHEVIDGRAAVAAHGTREMPLWGLAYRVEAADQCRGPDCRPESYVNARIAALVDHIGRLQVKQPARQFRTD
jgi:mono/diheme cytochrome c family protein